MQPISQTAYFACDMRAIDARRPRPICGDTYAEVFMSLETRQIIKRFKGLTNHTWAMPMRHRMIDDILKAELGRRPERLILIIGCGFDCRAFRLRGGHWIEIDDPQVHAPTPSSAFPTIILKNPCGPNSRRMPPMSRPLLYLKVSSPTIRKRPSRPSSRR